MNSPPNRFLLHAGVVRAMLGLVAVALDAQEPLNPPAPLLRNSTTRGSAGVVVSLNAAQRAQDLGMPSVAADILRSLRDEPGADRAVVGLALASALLDSDRPAEAEQVLESIQEPRGAPWRLRLGLAALQNRRRDIAQVQYDSLRVEDLPELDRPWFWFLAGALYDSATPRDVRRANENYRKAELASSTDLARARFQLAGEEVRLRLLGRPSDADLKQAKDNAERFPGQAFGYSATGSYAMMLAAAGQRAESVAVLQRVLIGVPAQERVARDELRFRLGLVGDRGRNGAGRNALNQLLENGQDPERQRQALEMLAEASREEPARGQFRAELDRLIAAKIPHPVLESLWYYRAQLALADKDFARAEEDAMALLKQFPLSPLRVHALGVLTQSAWEQRRYRLAADYARKARADLVPAVRLGAAGGNSVRARLELGVLEAEASYRAGDFRNAADAYAAVLSDRPAELEPNRVTELMYQRVLAEIKAGSGEAAKVLDDLERDPSFDLESRWQAEWSLARALQLSGEAGAQEAYGRINTLMTESAPSVAALRPELRARMLWLQVKLAFESGQAEQAVKLAEGYLATTLTLEAGLRAEIASDVVLLKARAEFAAGREPVGLESLQRLRSDYPRTEAAVSSFLIEAEYYAAQDKIDEARNRLVRLTDNPAYKDSEYVPLALFRLALLSERLGREENLQEANKRIEELVRQLGAAPVGAPEQALLFAARFRQGDIFRKLNDFPAAQRAYEDLVNRYPKRPDVVLAQLALAECHNAQSSTDPSAADRAQLIFEQLRDRVDAPLDVRVEAGYNLGALLARRGKTEEAAKVWWRDVITPFLIDETHPLEQNAKRPYWLARTLLDLGELQEKRGRYDEAKEAFQIILRKQLPFGAGVARARLQQLGVVALKAAP